MKTVRDIVIIIALAVFMVTAYFGAVLQESYRITPVTEIEKGE